MTTPQSVYRRLVRLYPSDFRARYGDDLVQHFADLIRDRGWRAAWIRAAVDLAITVPRYRLESTMSSQRGATTLLIATVLSAAGGVLCLLMGVYPGALLLVVALVLAVAQRDALTRALGTDGSNRRRQRLIVAVLLGVVSAVSFTSYVWAVDDGIISDVSIVAHSAIALLTTIGAIAFLIAGLLTPRSRADLPHTPAS